MNGKGGQPPLEGKDPKVFGACDTMPPDPDPLPPSPYQPLPRRYDDKPGDRFKEVLGRGGSWSKECGGPYCYGVPIYRQYLTGKSGHNDKGEVIGTPTREWSTWYDNQCGTQAATNDKCNFPFARMNGASEWQRDVMTVNNGKFYIDTTRSKDGQLFSEALGKPGEPTEAYVECSKQTSGNCQPRSVNVFEATKTYMVFFLFAKNDTQTKNYTKQTYQIYVGEGFKPDTGFKGVKITGTENRFKYDEWTTPWKAEMIGSDGKPNPTGDILQVTVDFSQVTGVQFDPKKAISETCKPASFCQWGMARIGGAGACDTSLKDNDPRVVMNPNLKNIAKKICSEWAVKDLDCPAGGCLGFAFTLPDKFEAKNQYKRPTPEDIKDTDSVWSKFSFKQAGQSASDCTYDDGKNTPGKGSCGVPDCANGMGNPPFCDKPTQ